MRARLPVLFSLCASVLAFSAACSDAANPITAPDGPAVLNPITSVAVSPDKATLSAGSHVAMKVTSADSSGKPVTGPATWSSSDTTVAKVSGSGDVTAVAPGQATITVVVGKAHAAATVVVSTSSATGPSDPTTGGSTTTQPSDGAKGSGLWTDEPAGMHVLTDNPWNSLTPSGWTPMGTSSGNIGIGSDAGAPASPSSVLQFTYPKGFSGSGSAPGSEYFMGFDGSKELFVAFDWKVSADWQQHSAGFSKLLYIVHCSTCNNTSQPGGRVAYVMMMQGRAGGPYHLMMNDEIYNTNKIQPNVGDGTVVPGRWYRVEISVKAQSASGANDGWIKFWIDGKPVAQYLNMPIPSRGFEQLTIDPVWGGVNPTISKSHTDYMWFDHIHVSAK